MDDASFRSTVLIDKEHEIFKGHFPSTPVVPGVCMMQMIKEMLEEKINHPLQLISADNIKFLSVMNPLETPQAEITIRYSFHEDKSYRVDGSISANNLVYFKIARAIYK